MIHTDIEESTCPGCGARVVVVRDSLGKRVLLNSLPDAAGSMYFGAHGRIRSVGEKPPGGVPLFTPHRSTCPQVDLFDNAEKLHSSNLKTPTDKDSP
jgi:hypothetical protein